MTQMDVNSLRNLGLSQEQIRKLDALDGREDGKIEKSVFDAASAIINNDDTAQKTMARAGGVAVLKQVADVLVEFGKKAAKATSDGVPAEVEPVTEQPPEVGKMQEMAEAAIKYYETNGSMKGFTFTGFPIGIEGMDITTQIGFDDSSNDTFTITEDGQQVAVRNPDAFTLQIKFVFNGKEYTVSAESQNVAIFNDLAKQEFLSPLYDYINKVSGVNGKV